MPGAAIDVAQIEDPDGVWVELLECLGPAGSRSAPRHAPSFRPRTSSM
jgi:hypothetical protein